MAEESGKRLRALMEVFAIAAIFAAAGAWPVPDVNETVYLTKARHAGDPSWCAGDFFLETPDAHGIFYFLIGPLAAWLPLELTAWIGRIAGWLALAVGFHHLSAATVTGEGWSSGRRTWAMLAAAAIFSLALRQTNAAGEWVIGGCEAKVFAWALVFGGLGEFVRGRFAGAWCLLGGATAFHPLVGGWAMMAATAVRLLLPWPPAVASSRWRIVLLAAGCLLAAAGVVPALFLNAGVDQATRQLAARIYVVERLPHHLFVQTFSTGFVARHLLAATVWWFLTRVAGASEARRKLTALTLASLAISLVGVVISLAEPWASGFAHGLLRYYWFRLGDVVVPLALAIFAAAVLADDAVCRWLMPWSPAIVRVVATLLLTLDLAAESTHWPLPGRTLAARADSKVDAAGWSDICDWLREHTPIDACVLTPRGATSLAWRTGRREVVSWKNSPQDAASLVAWRERIMDCFVFDQSMSESARSTATIGEQRMRKVADRYGATHAIVPLDAPGVDDLTFPRLYENSVYAIFKLDDHTGSPVTP